MTRFESVSRCMFLLILALQVFRAVLAVVQQDWFRLFDVISIACLAVTSLIWVSTARRNRTQRSRTAEDYLSRGLWPPYDVTKGTGR